MKNLETPGKTGRVGRYDLKDLTYYIIHDSRQFCSPRMSTGCLDKSESSV